MNSTLSVALPADFPVLANIRTVARALNFSYSTVRKWTYKQSPRPAGWPDTVKVGRSTRYRRMDIEAWINGLGAIEFANATPSVNEIKRGRGRPRKILVPVEGFAK